METTKLLRSAASAGLLLAAGTAAALGEAVVDIPYTRTVLENGLTLLVHEDHKAPIVAVNVWYHVGSKNERPGKTGFAHLFEHLMFNGSEHFNDDYFKATEKVGATDMNGTTSEDRTNYFQNAPKEALDTLLWLESDRMGHLLGAIDQARLDEQRGVVQNEKRQYENQPYAVAHQLITRNTWPEGHPYSWTVIGSMEDLNAASLADVKAWFKSYYGAANATLVVAGDVRPDEVLEKVRRHFGSVPPGPPVARQQSWIAKRSGTRRQRVEDRVPQARLYKVWNIPNYGSTEGNLLGLVSDVLADGKPSRLYKRLVVDEGLATDVSAYADLSEIAGQFMIVATAKQGVSLARVEACVDEELKAFLRDGPSSRELKRVKAQAEAAFIRSVERIGGFGGKSDLLACNSVFTGDPAYYKVRQRELQDATAKQLRETAQTWLSDGAYVLEVSPFPPYASATNDVDRSELPLPALKPSASFPAVQRATLSNGLKVLLAERNSVPTVQFCLLVDAGFASDPADRPGTARLALEMLLEGTRDRTALEISEEAALLGANLSAACSLDTASVTLNALRGNLDASLDLFADVVLNPAFRGPDFERLRALRLASIRREKAEPSSAAQRVLPRVLFGAGHPYGAPLSGSGTERGVAALTPAEMARFHAAWFRPNNATLAIAGDVTLAVITAKLERLFAGWKPAPTPEKRVSLAALPAGPTVTLVDRPGSIQSVICVGNVAPPKANPEELAIELMNQVLGGGFTSRINMNLREDKHWTYGARTLLPAARSQRPFFVSVAVQSDKTRDAMRELDRELRDIVGARPVTDAEFARVVTSQTNKLPGTWETQSSLLGSLAEIACFGLPDDHFRTYARRIAALKREALEAAARTVVRPDRLSWIVVGDRAKIEGSIRELGLGELRFADADGEPATP